MISVADALTKVLERARPRPSILRPAADAMFQVLAQDVVCTLDSPPHDKSIVDGYAVRTADTKQAETVLRVIEEVTAGQVPAQSIVPQTATRIMTGAPVPVGADAVVMVEQSESAREADGSETVRFLDTRVTVGQNILRRGESMRSGDTVLRAGHFLRAIEIGLLAELGVRNVEVYPQPQVAILATGNELVPCGEQPAAGQIRNSNGPMLCGMTIEAHGKPFDLGIARDNQSDLTRLIRSGVESEVLILSGGVSAGVLDLVPAVLEQLGVKQVFHKVELKPGKPLWFGVLEKESGSTLVFGLPGNPVSSLVCFHLFVRPAIARLLGRTDEPLQRLPAVLAVEHTTSGNRPTYFPGRAAQAGDHAIVHPLPWRGSADLRTLTDANALIYFPPGSKTYRANDPVTIWLL
jgi:molybdopterin molybdotransferase